MATSEREFGEAVIKILKDKGRCMTISEILKEIPKYVDLDEEDMAESKTRPGEELWKQRVRNIVSHRNSSDGNIIYDGKVKYENGKLCLPD